MGNRRARLVVYRGRGIRRPQRWRWRLVAINGRIIAMSSEGYTDRHDAITNAIDVLSGSYADYPLTIED